MAQAGETLHEEIYLQQVFFLNNVCLAFEWENVCQYKNILMS